MELEKEKIKILVVDDEKNIRNLIVQTIENESTEAEAVKDGYEAIEKVREKKFNFVLLDIKMPGMDGIETLKKIREIDKDLNVIMITAHGNVDNAVESMRHGAVDFLKKPFEPNIVRNLILKVIERESIDEDSEEIKYDDYIDLAKKFIKYSLFDKAISSCEKAIDMEHSNPVAYNILGMIHELMENIEKAKEYYRKSVKISGNYAPAVLNLKRLESSD